MPVFDLALLRRKVAEKMRQDQVTVRELANQTGLSISGLLTQLNPKPHPVCPLDVVVGLMAWLGTTDFADFSRNNVPRKTGRGWTANWMLLRILLREKQERLGWHGGQVADALRISRHSYTAYLNGTIPTLTSDHLIKMLAWLEIYDWREICDE